jgi:hypothetical protein
LSCFCAVVLYEIDAEMESPTNVTGIGAFSPEVEAAAMEAPTRQARTRAVRAMRTSRR